VNETVFGSHEKALKQSRLILVGSNTRYIQEGGMRSLIFSATVALSLMGVAHAGDKMQMNEMDVIVYGRPAFAIEGFVPPIVADSEDETFARIAYLPQPTLRGALTPKERIDAGFSAFEVQQWFEFVAPTGAVSGPI
jgi:hypothetical protein